MTFVMRTSGEPLALARAARQAVAGVDPNQPIYNVRDVESYLDDQVRSPRYFMVLLMAFAGIAMALGAIGIYGVAAHAVAQRTQELGIRRALGANAQNVLGLVLGQTAVVTVVGLVLGLAASLLLTQFITAFLWGVSPSDPFTLTEIATLLAITAAGACVVPAIRAIRVDPISVLRHE